MQWVSSFNYDKSSTKLYSTGFDMMLFITRLNVMRNVAFP